MGQHVEAVDCGRAGAGDGGSVEELSGSQHLDGAGGVLDGLWVEAEAGEGTAAVGEEDGMADDGAELGLVDARHGERAVVDEEVELLDDEEVVAEEEGVVAEGGAARGGLDGRSEREERGPRWRRRRSGRGRVCRRGRRPWQRARCRRRWRSDRPRGGQGSLGP